MKRIIAAKPAGKMLTILKLVSHGDTGMLFLSGTGDHPPRMPLQRPPQLRGVRGAAPRTSTRSARRSTCTPAGWPATRASTPAVPVDSPNTISGSWKGGTGLGYKLLDRMAVLTGIPTMAAIDVQLYLETVRAIDGRISLAECLRACEHRRRADGPPTGGIEFSPDDSPDWGESFCFSSH